MRKIVSAVLTLLMAFSLLLMTAGSASANPTAGGGYSSSYSGESVFTNQAAGQSGQFSAIFFNDGRQSWAPGVVGLLICLADKVTCNVASPNAAYASGWFSSTVYATVSATVAPGQNGFFVYNFTVPGGTAPGTVATFNGDVGLIATGAETRPEGYFQTNTTPSAAGGLTISPASAALPVSGQQQFTVTGAPTGATVNWTVTGGCGAVTNQGLFAATATNSPTQPCSVVATSGGLGASAPITVFGPAASIQCSATKTTASTSTSSASTVKATLLDANGNVVSNNNSDTIQFTNNSPTLVSWSSTTPDEAGGLQSSSATTRGRIVQAGVASVNVNTTSTTGTAVVSVTDTSNTSLTGCSQSITVVGPGAATNLSAAFFLKTISANGGATSVLEVDENDANGNTVASDSTTTITISRDSGASICGTAGGTAGSDQKTLSGGSALFTITSTTTPGTCAWSATANAAGVASASATLTTVLVGAANKLAVTSNNSPKIADGVTTLSVQVALQDANGNPVMATGQGTTDTLQAKLGTDCAGTKANGATDSVAVASLLTRGPGSAIKNPFANDANTSTASGSGATVTELAGIQASNGSSGTGTTNLAIFKFESTFATTCTVTFSDTSNTNVTNANATVTFTAGGPAALGCTFSPSPIIADGSSTSVATVSTTDANGNLATGGVFSVSFSRKDSAADAGSSANVTTLLTASPQSTSNGIAQFTVKSVGSSNKGTDLYQASTTISGNTVKTPADTVTAADSSTACKIGPHATLSGF